MPFTVRPSWQAALMILPVCLSVSLSVPYAILTREQQKNRKQNSVCSFPRIAVTGGHFSVQKVKDKVTGRQKHPENDASRVACVYLRPADRALAASPSTH